MSPPTAAVLKDHSGPTPADDTAPQTITDSENGCSLICNRYPIRLRMPTYYITSSLRSTLQQLFDLYLLTHIFLRLRL